MKTIEWHQLDGEKIMRKSNHWFRGATHRVIAQTTAADIYDNGFVRYDGTQGTYITDDPEQIGEAEKQAAQGVERS